MDAAHGDVDGDGDIDLVLAQEFATNLVLINDGSGAFSIGSLSGGQGDNEEVVLADIDDDLDIDIVAVHEDDMIHAIFRNDGAGRYNSDPTFLPENLRSTANAVELIDLDGDLRAEILIGNRGMNLILSQQEDGSFGVDSSFDSIGEDITQDLLLVDVDDDADQDLFVANEGDNRLFMNQGEGEFLEETDLRLPGGRGESRQADSADIDGDGDLDIIVGNVQVFADFAPTNQLLVNDGTGHFTDVTEEGLGAVSNSENSFTIHFIDIDTDGYVDVLSGDSQREFGTVRLWMNHGDGRFDDVDPLQFFSAQPAGSTFDIEIGDFNSDGVEDLYFCNRSGADQLFLSES